MQVYNNILNQEIYITSFLVFLGFKILDKKPLNLITMMDKYIIYGLALEDDALKTHIKKLYFVTYDKNKNIIDTYPKCSHYLQNMFQKEVEK